LVVIGHDRVPVSVLSLSADFESIHAIMKPASNNLPVFAMDETTGWEDLENVMAASVDYQSNHLGRIIPLMFFAPMTEPENLDAWEPMRSMPDNLLIVSIERSTDAVLVQALKHAEDAVGELRFAASFPAVRIDYERPFADVYQQMDAAEIAAFASPQPGRDEPSFFFIRGPDAVQAFSRGLRTATARKSS
jgi:hypothetical protein